MSAVRLKFRLDRNDSGVWGTDPTDDCGFEVLRSTEVSLNGSWRITDPAIRCLTATERLIGPLELGDMLVTKSSGSEAHVGKAALVGIAEARRNAYFSNFSQRLRPTTALEARYLFYLWNSRHGRAHMEVSSSGSMAIRNLTGDMLGLLRIPIDRLTNQQLIADFLDREMDRIDALIDAKRRLIDLLTEKRTALITHAVTKGLDPSAPMKDSGIPWIGQIPAHWTVRSLKFLAKMKSGVNITSDDIAESGTHPVYGGNGQRGYADSFTHDGDYVLIGRQGALSGNINYASGKFHASEHAVVAGLTIGRNTFWFGELLRAMNLNQYSQASAQPGISVDVVSALKAPVPSEPERGQIERFLERHTSTSQDIQTLLITQLGLLAEYRQALITAAVTGQLDDETLKGRKPADEAMGVEVPS